MSTHSPTQRGTLNVQAIAVTRSDLRRNVIDRGPGGSCATAIDLSTVTSPYTGNTSSSTNFLASGCSSHPAPDLVFKHLVPSGYTITLQQTSNFYDSFSELHYGGSCPGTTVVECQDHPDLTPLSWTNTLGYIEWVYYVQSGYGGESGSFTLNWTVMATGM